MLSQRNELTTEKGELVAENNSLVEERDGLTDELAMLLAEKEAQMRNTLRREPKRVRLIQELKNERVSKMLALLTQKGLLQAQI